MNNGNNSSALTYELVDKQRDGDDVEYEQIKYVLSVFFQVRDNAIQTALEFSFVIVHGWVHVETGHSVKTLRIT